MLTLIWAEDENHVIGNQGKLPWHLPADARFFRQQTTGQTVIMGKQTFLSIGRPLPKRTNVVLSATLSAPAGVLLMRNLAMLKQYLRQHHNEQLFVIGGVRLYQALMPQADRLLVTRIDASFSGDTKMPTIDAADWHLTNVDVHPVDDQNVWPYRFETYERI
ncbi:dihydrofolate reductase [Furfurilactobacillus curtus]|uniref:Dihydrofolate reductase n=1 Tax=Furfurilactobacillus curtus TaxID=1746200 RepID=A0ABQ5JM87_9LACO